MRRKLLQIDNISNNQKINQIFSHELNINKKIKKVTNLDTDLATLAEYSPDAKNPLAILGALRHYRFKYIFIPPRGNPITVNSANLMTIGFLYSINEKYEKYFTNPNYSLLIYTPLFLDYYLKIERVIYANTFDKYAPIINFSICNLQKELSLITGEISSSYKDVNYMQMKEYYIKNSFENDIKQAYWNISPYKLRNKLHDKDLLSRFMRTYYMTNKDNEQFKCKYFWINKNKKQYIILNDINVKDMKLIKQLKEKMQIKIDKVLNALASTILMKKLF